MRILHTNFHRGWGGQPARILTLALGFRARGHLVTLAAPRGSILARRARESGVPTLEEAAFRKPKHLISAIRDVRAVAAHLRAVPYDLIDSHGSQDLWTIVLARRLAGVQTPLVLTRHNTKPVADHLFNRWLLRHVTYLMVVSDSVLPRYEPFFRRGDLDRRRVAVVHSSYPPERFRPGLDGGAVRASLGLADAQPLVGVIGRLVSDKAQDDFLRAAALLRERRPDVRFVLVGTGTSEGALRAQAAGLGLAGAVAFLGFRDDIPQITAALTISVLPSVGCEASPAVLKEALACGVPVVATDIGGAREIVRDGETGLIVPPRHPERLAGAILSLLEDSARARAMGRLGTSDMPARFAPERLVEGTLDAYRAALASPAPNAE